MLTPPPSDRFAPTFGERPPSDESPRDAEEIGRRALDAYRRGQRAVAEQLAGDLARQVPLHPVLAYLSGAFAVEDDRLAVAVLHFHHATLLSPRDADAHHGLAEALRGCRQHRLAIAS